MDISKELFVHILTSIEIQFEKDGKLLEELKQANVSIEYDNQVVIRQLLEILIIAFPNDHQKAVLEQFVSESLISKKPIIIETVIHPFIIQDKEGLYRYLLAFNWKEIQRGIIADIIKSDEELGLY